MFWFKIRYFSNILVRNTISFPMFSMQIRYCSNVLESKSHSSNFCPKSHTVQILSEKKFDTSPMFEVEQWCFSEVLAKIKCLLILLGKNIDSFRMFWIELWYVLNVFGTNSTFFAVFIYNYNLLRMVFTKFNTFRIRPISDDFL